jgi:Terminase small subunit
MALTRMQSAFLREYLLDSARDGEQAAKRAGYSAGRAKRHAKELLAHPEIKTALDATVQDALAPFEITPQRLRDELVRNIKTCRANGNDVSSIAEARKNIELLGRDLGMFADRIEVDAGDKLIALLKSRQQRTLPKPEPEILSAEVVAELPAEAKPLTLRQVRKELKRQETHHAIEKWKQLTTQPAKPLN